MHYRLNTRTSLDWLIALLAMLAAVAVLQTFIIGKHYIIPSVILLACVVMGNLAWFALNGAIWAKRMNFWCGFLLTSHCFFALFWSVKYRALLGDKFELVFVPITLILCGLTGLYAKHNHLFAKSTK